MSRAHRSVRPGSELPGPMTRWFKRVKRRLGYYELRSRLWEAAFRRSLRPSDVFLVGHPKSGNTWLAYMLAILLTGDETERVTLLNVGRYVPFVHGRDHRIARYSGLTSPRVFRNEYPRYWSRYPKIVYLMRDPRAVLPSLWEMYRVMYADHSLSLDGFLEQYFSQTGIFVDWNRDLVRWDRQVSDAVAEAARDRRILLLKYEDLVLDRRAGLARVAEFVGLEPTAADLASAVARGGFDAMRAMEDRHGVEAYTGRAMGTGPFVRAGRIDGWREEVEPRLVSLIETELGSAMRLAGYQVTA